MTIAPIFAVLRLYHIGLLLPGYLTLGSQNHYYPGKHHTYKDNEQDGGDISESQSIATQNGNPFADFYRLTQFEEDEQDDKNNADYHPGINPTGSTEGVGEVLRRYHGTHHRCGEGSKGDKAAHQLRRVCRQRDCPDETATT